MTEFDDLRNAFRAAFEAKEKAGEDDRRARQLHARLIVSKQRFDRTTSRTPRFMMRAQNVASGLAAAENVIRTRAAALRAAAQSLAAARQAFERFTDPRIAVTHMRDDAPFLLFPVRLEAHFRPIAGSANKELCIRVYPDDCSVDSFEPLPSDAEVENAKRYWIAEWQAGRNVEQRKAAWRSLVAAHGAGRAAWLRSTYQPANLNEMPTKTSPDDVVLVVVTDTPVSPADGRHIEEFWRDMWMADGDKTRVEFARARLQSTLRSSVATIEANPPVNFNAPVPAPLVKDSVRVSAAFLVFKPDADLDVQQNAWSRPPRVAAWPDRFALVLYRAGAAPTVHLGEPIPNPLIVGVDPAAPAAEQLRNNNAGDLVVPPTMKWMTDFDEAVRVGMGFKVEVGSTREQQMFEKLLVIGVRASADAASGRTELEDLITRQKNSLRGFAIVSQGTPTNNTEENAAGYSRIDDADESFDRVVLGNVGDKPTADARNKTDGQWFAEWLGISHDVLKDIPNAGGFDQAEAKAMNTALWDGTLGYWMGTLMNPVFSEDVIERTRNFFLNYVSGRGAIPAVRVGNQPYGVLPITAFGRTRWMASLAAPRAIAAALTANPLGEHEYLEKLRDVLARMNTEWRRLANDVPRVGGANDQQQALFKVIGLHATSVTYAQRWVESFDSAYNRFAMAGVSSLMDASVLSQLLAGAHALLQSMGYAGADQPTILQQFHFAQHNPLKGPVVDVVPLSEMDPLSAVTSENNNYIEWLAAAARTSLDAVRAEQGFATSKPTALLYLLLRYAILEGYFNASLKIREAKGEFNGDAIRIARKHGSFMQIKSQPNQIEGRYTLLVSPDIRITGTQRMRVADYITRELRPTRTANLGVNTLREQISALERLARLPTARLERLFAEHVDCCSYRLDAWRLGLVYRQLAHMRELHRGPEARRTGVLLGAYGWLLDVKPRARTLTPMPLNTPELRTAFGAGSALMRDSTNGGYIHAPSLNQAVTAAILRAGFMATASSDNPETCAIKLTSERVRLALGILDGIRAGLSLGSILGKQFERGLHDRGAHRMKYAFREVLPLDVNRLKATKLPPASRFTTKSRNVVDGMALVEKLQQFTANGAALRYPFGLQLRVEPAVTMTERAAVEAVAARLLESFDALADLFMAEGVFQAVNGNWARVTANMDAAAGVHLPPEPDVIRTPSLGFQLTHRVALHLDASVSPTSTGTARTPLSTVDPALNDWLGATLPGLGSIACKVSYTSAAGPTVTRDVSLSDLGLQPIDVLDALSEQHGATLVSQSFEDRVVRLLQASPQAPHGDAVVVSDGATADARAIRVSYISTVAAPVTIARASALVRVLRSMLASARPLLPSDLSTPREASEAPSMDSQVFVDPSRVQLVRNGLDDLAERMRTYVDALAPYVHMDPTNTGARAALVARADRTIAEAVTLLHGAMHFRVSPAGIRFMHDWKRKLTAWMRAEVTAVEQRWTRALAEHDALVASSTTQSDVTKQLELLEQAERRVSTAATPRPVTPAVLRATIATKRAAFQARRNQFRALANAIPSTVANQRSAFLSLLPIGRFDVVQPSVEPYDDIIRVMSNEAYDAVNSVRAELVKRIDAADDAINAHSATADATIRVDELRKAARILLSDDVMLIPEMSFEEDHTAELSNAIGASASLLTHLQTNERIQFPVDEWLYGCARVREPMRHWEKVLMLTGALGRPEPQLTPIQLPFKANDVWLAGKFPNTYQLDGERLLYTAHWRTAFSGGQRLCGLLIDEWTEVIPAREGKTGIAFHCDVPSSEPVHAWGLITPTAARGAWTWDDLVDGVNEMIEIGKTRLVEPSQIDNTPYAMFLPAVTTASSHGELTISANLARNNLRISINQ